MQRAVHNLPVGRVIERVGELAGHADGLRRWRRAILADDDVEGVGRGEILGQICAVAVDAGGTRRRDDRMLQLGGDQLVEFVYELMDAFRRKIEAEQLDGDESIAILIVRTENRSQSTIADLVEHAKWTEGVGRRGAGSVRVQSRLLS